MDTMNPKPMKNLLPLLLLFVTSSAFAQQQKKTIKDTISYRYLPRYYNTSPCGGCPPDKLKKPPREKDKNSPYKWDNEKPIVIDPSDTTLIKWLIIKKAVREDTDPSIL